MRYRWLRFEFLHLAAVAAAIVSALPVCCFAAPPRKYSDDELAMISRLVARVLAPNHYRAHKLDSEMSRRLYDEFLKMLDTGKEPAGVRSQLAAKYKLMAAARDMALNK